MRGRHEDREAARYRCCRYNGILHKDAEPDGRIVPASGSGPDLWKLGAGSSFSHGPGGVVGNGSHAVAPNVDNSRLF